MRYLSVCSGIEAASVAWKPLGWEAIGFSEIEPFPCSVLQHRFPDVPNFGDMTKFREWNIEPGSVDVVVGGSPCQSFSVAGLRGGLEDERGNLALTYCRILDWFKPRWFIWENVPGVLSSSGGRDFGSILGAMAELGYSFSWRILDAQNWGVPQRRRRVFVVGHLGSWTNSAKVLFEPESVCGHPEASGQAGQDIAGTLRSRASAGGGLGTDFELAGGLQVAGALTGRIDRGGVNSEGNDNHIIPMTQFGPIAGTLTQRYDSSPCHDRGQNIVYNEVAAAVTSRPYSDGAAEESKLVATSTGNTAHCLNAGGMGRQDYETETMVVAFSGRDRGDDGRGYEREPNITGPITETVDATKPPRVAGATLGVRRLLPEECEKLQGFQRGWTQVPHRGRPAADGPRYKAIGNSMAVPVMAWIGQRIQMVESGKIQ